MAVIALAILLDDGGPVLFRQERLGRGRRPFAILKFRSMRDGRSHAGRPDPARHWPRRTAPVRQHPARRHERRRAASADRVRRRPARLDGAAVRLPLAGPAGPDRTGAGDRARARDACRWGWIASTSRARACRSTCAWWRCLSRSTHWASSACAGFSLDRAAHNVHNRANEVRAVQVIRAEHLGMCFGVRDAIELAKRHADAAPLTILGDLVHNAVVLADLRARGIAVVARPGAREDAHGDGDGSRRVGTEACELAGTGPPGRRSHVPARAAGASRRPDSRLRRLPPGRHRPARSRRSAGADRRPRCLRCRAGRKRCAGARGTRADGRRRANDAAERPGASAWSPRFDGGSPGPTSVSSIRSVIRPSSGSMPPPSWHVDVTSSLWSAAPAATTRASSWTRAAGTVRACITSRPRRIFAVNGLPPRRRWV